MEDKATTAGGHGGAGRRTLLLGLLLVGVVLAGAVAAVSLPGGPERAPGGETGVARLQDRVAPDARMPLPDMVLDGFGDGGPVRLAAYRGSPLVLNFWATWCAPCVEEMPDFQRVHEELADEVAFLGVDVQDSPLNAEPFVERLGITYDLAVDPRAELYAALRVYGMPTTLLVDEEGTIVYRHTGPLTAHELRELITGRLGVGA